MTHGKSVVPVDAERVLDAAAAYLKKQYGASHGLDHPVDRERILSSIPAAPAPSSLAGGSFDPQSVTLEWVKVETRALEEWRAEFGDYVALVTLGHDNVWAHRVNNSGRLHYKTADEAKAAALADLKGRLSIRLHAARKTVALYDAALSPEAPARESVAAAFQRWNRSRATDQDVGEDDDYEIGKRDGYEQAVQDIDLLTGGDGEFYVSTAGDDCPDVATMKSRISDRFAALTPHHEAPAEKAEYVDAIGALSERTPEAPAEGVGENVETILSHLTYENVRHMGRVGGLSDWIDRFKANLQDALRARSSAPEAREGEAVAWRKQVWVADGIGTGWLLSNEKPEPNHQPTEIEALYTHPAAPSADKLLIAVEALEGAKQMAGRLDGHDAGMMEDEIQAIDQALAALKAEGAK